MKRIFVVGQGLAGAFVSKKLLERGYSVSIAARNDQSASRISSGLINPVTGLRFVHSEDFQDLYKQALNEYRTIPGVISEFEVYRFIYSDEEFRSWTRRRNHLEVEGLCRQVSDDCARELSTMLKLRSEPKAVINIHHAARIDTTALLNTLQQKASIHPLVSWNEKEFVVTENTVGNYDEFEAVILCEGWGIMQNPLFQHLPFMFAKGQFITIRFRDQFSLPSPTVILAGRSMTKLSDVEYRFGATHHWTEINEQATDEAVQLLSAELSEHIEADFVVTDTRAGVRPVMRDFNPIVGRHPDYRAMYVLNGLGAKGALRAPALATLLVDYMEGRATIPPQYDVQRFFRK